MNPTPKSILLWIAAVAVVAFSYMKMGWPGVALSVGMLVFWVLLLYSRMLRTLRAAADRPKGQVSSAVMLHAKLQRGLSLLQVVAMAQSLGDEVSKEPEVWRWTDASQSSVDCTFAGGKLSQWTLRRPEPTA